MINYSMSHVNVKEPHPVEIVIQMMSLIYLHIMTELTDEEGIKKFYVDDQAKAAQKWFLSKDRSKTRTGIDIIKK